MINDLVRDLHLLQKADSLIGKLWLSDTARRFALFVFAGLIATFGLGMTNVAGFYALRDGVGLVWAAVIVALADLVLAGIVILVARNIGPGPEMELALDNRKMAIDAIQADARDLEVTITSIGQDLRDARDNISAFVRDPLDAAAQKLLIPAAISFIQGLRAKKDQPAQETPADPSP